MRIDALALATDAQLETLPPGLYVACNDAGEPIEREHLDCYNAETDRDEFGPAILLARVRDSGLVPRGAHAVTFRKDGCQIIKQWVLNREVT